MIQEQTTIQMFDHFSEDLPSITSKRLLEATVMGIAYDLFRICRTVQGYGGYTEDTGLSSGLHGTRPCPRPTVVDCLMPSPRRVGGYNVT